MWQEANKSKKPKVIESEIMIVFHALPPCIFKVMQYSCPEARKYAYKKARFTLDDLTTIQDARQGGNAKNFP